MSKYNFYDIVKMGDIRVSIPKDSHFSIGTSPYYAHQHGLAIDIYQFLTLKDYDVLSPVSGRLSKIKKLAAPKPRFKHGVDVDYLILINNPKNSQLVWKLMHVKPEVKEGEYIEVGEVLGKTIRNGYFAYWSSPHLHLELRNVNDAVRARGGKNFSIAIEKKERSENYKKTLNTTQIPITIHSIYPEMILVTLPSYFYSNFKPFFGIKGKVNDKECILDGGIPHYKIGTAIFAQKYSSDRTYPVLLGNIKIGNIHEINENFGFYKFNNVKFILNDKEIRGISLYLANFLPLIKIIPYKKNQFSFKPKSTTYLKLISEEPSKKGL